MLPKPPTPEPPRIATLDGLAPRFRTAVLAVLADMAAAGYHARIFESLRTNERQAWLYGFGRDYDDGRGPVTKAPTADAGWHYYGLAVDVVEADATPWTAPQSFWQTLGASGKAHGCAWGGTWKVMDLPHLQWGKCRVSPSSRSLELYQAGGIEAVWRAVGAL